MKVIDENYKAITNYDLSTGYLVDTEIIKENAKPIDNITKFCWDDDDLEIVQMYIKSEPKPEKGKTLEERLGLLEKIVSKLTGQEDLAKWMSQN